MIHVRHILVTALLLAAGAIAMTARAETVTYTISGNTEANYPNPGDMTCNLTVTASGDVTGSSSTSWSYLTATSASLSLPGGITLAFGTNKTSNGMAVQDRLVIEGTTSTGGYITLSHASKLVYYIELKDHNGNTIHEASNLTKSYTWRFQQAAFLTIVVAYDTSSLTDETTDIGGLEDEYAYTGSAITPEPVVTWNGLTLTRNTHYSVAYSDNTTPGTATVTVTGVSPFQGTLVQEFGIYDPNEVTRVWNENVNVEYDQTFTQRIRVIGDVTLTIADGVTFTATRGITIDSGKTLTISGEGTLTVKKSNKGSTGAKGSSSSINGVDGGMGPAGIVGNVIVNGGKVNVTGGQGGQGGAGYSGGGNGGNGGRGGAAIDGSLTVNGGQVTVTGGPGGQGGTPGREASGSGGRNYFGGSGGRGGTGITGSLTVAGGTVATNGGDGGMPGHVTGSSGHDGIIGHLGYALGATVTCTVYGYVIQESNDKTTWSAITSGSTSTKYFVRVKETDTFSLTAHQATFAEQTRYWVTFYHATKIFALPAGAQAFTMGSDKALYRVGDGSVVPADCAVVIMADASALTGVSGGSGTLTLTSTSASAPSVSGNILRGESADTSASTLVSGSQKVYVLGASGDTVGFFEFTGSEVPAGKAYYVE